MTQTAPKSSIFSLPGCSDHWQSLCSHPPPCWGLTVTWYVFLSVMGQMGFCFLFSGHRKPHKVKERVALRPLDWVVSAGLLWVFPAGPRGRSGDRGHRASVQMLWLVPTLSTSKTFWERERLERCWGHRHTGEPTDPWVCSQDSHGQGSDTGVWERECGAKTTL